MSSLARKFGFAIALATFGLSGHQAVAQSAPLQYWLPGGWFGFGGGLASNSYGNFPSFDGNSSQDGRFAYMTGNAPTGWLVSGERGNLGLNGLSSSGAFGNYSYDGAQVAYRFKGDTPVTFFAGFDSLKYNLPGAGGPVSPFSSPSSLPAGYTARAGIEYRPTSNVSLSFGATFVQPNAERMDSDINAPLLPGQSPMFSGR